MRICLSLPSLLLAFAACLIMSNSPVEGQLNKTKLGYRWPCVNTYECEDDLICCFDMERNVCCGSWEVPPDINQLEAEGSVAGGIVGALLISLCCCGICSAISYVTYKKCQTHDPSTTTVTYKTSATEGQTAVYSSVPIPPVNPAPIYQPPPPTTYQPAAYPATQQYYPTPQQPMYGQPPPQQPMYGQPPPQQPMYGQPPPQQPMYGQPPPNADFSCPPPMACAPPPMPAQTPGYQLPYSAQPPPMGYDQGAPPPPTAY